MIPATRQAVRISIAPPAGDSRHTMAANSRTRLKNRDMLFNALTQSALIRFARHISKTSTDLFRYGRNCSSARLASLIEIVKPQLGQVWQVLRMNTSEDSRQPHFGQCPSCMALTTRCNALACSPRSTSKLHSSATLPISNPLVIAAHFGAPGS